MQTVRELSSDSLSGERTRVAHGTPLLRTKLYVPPPRLNLVSRPRLLQRLNEGVRLDRRLTLISAPAGFGKTTLLSEWAAYLQSEAHSDPSVQNRFVWLSLDDGDNDPARFLAYLVAALQTAEPEVGIAVLEAIQSSGTGDAVSVPAVESILAPLINDISSLSGRIVLVLDDYHLIKSPPIHSTLAFLLDHLPAQMHLAVASRSDPSLPIARLRGRGLLTEIREADLRFTPAEASEFLNEVAGLDLAAADVAALEARTEGWITGLQLAAISMQGRDTDLVSSFVQAFKGSNRYVLDYLTEEVLQRQPEYIQSFLLRTSILNRLCGPLCDVVLEDPLDSQHMLEHLETRNLFVVPLDDERRWYRYHRLFADLLRARLGEAYPDLVSALHGRASAWYEDSGAIDDAVGHAVEAGNRARVGELVEVYGMPALMRGDLATVQRWLAVVPEDALRASARLCVLQAWVLLLTGQMRPLERALQQAEALITPDLGHLRGDIAAIRAYVAAQRGDVARTIELADEAIALLDDTKPGELGVVYFVLGGANVLRGDVAAAATALARASTVGQQGGNVHVAVPALNALAGLQIQQGRLHQALTTAQEAIGLATGPSGRPLPFAGGAVSALAEVAYERNELEIAHVYAEQSVDLSQRWGNLDSLGNSYLTLARVHIARGDLVGAAAAMQEADRVSQGSTPTPVFSIQLNAGWARLWLAQNDLVKIGRWAGDVSPELLAPLLGGERLILAQARLALGQPDEALRVLLPLLEMAREQGLNGITIEALVIQTLAYQSLGSRDRALEALFEALALAEPEGHVRCFVDRGKEMAGLLRRAASHGATSEHARRLLAQLEIGGQSGHDGGLVEAPQPKPTPALIEPLSERELEVLRLIADGLSNKEIAGRLVIATSTVKSHANHIYGKLGVRSRTQAIVLAQDLGLI